MMPGYRYSRLPNASPSAQAKRLSTTKFIAVGVGNPPFRSKLGRRIKIQGRTRGSKGTRRYPGLADPQSAREGGNGEWAAKLTPAGRKYPSTVSPPRGTSLDAGHGTGGRTLRASLRTALTYGKSAVVSGLMSSMRLNLPRISSRSFCITTRSRITKWCAVASAVPVVSAPAMTTSDS